MLVVTINKEKVLDTCRIVDAKLPQNFVDTFSDMWRWGDVLQGGNYFQLPRQSVRLLTDNNDGL